MADEMRYEAVQSGALEDGAIVAGTGATRGVHLNSGGGYRDTASSREASARPAGTDETFANVQDLRPRPAALLSRETAHAERSEASAGHGLAADLLTFAGGLGLGAAVMYFMDPERGRRRRALVRDQVAHLAATVPPGVRATRRDLVNRSRGLVATVRGRFGDDATDDETLVARVRSKVGRIVSHPGSIVATSADGVVTLSGPVLASEAEQLIQAVAGTRGVKEVRSQLEVYDEIDSISVPGLQGGTERMGARFELLQENWTPAARVVAGAAGATLALLAGRRKDVLGSAVGLLGVGLTARAVTNMPLERHASELAGDALAPVRERVAPVADRVRSGAGALGERVAPLAKRASEGAGVLRQRVEQLADTMTHRFTDLADSAHDRIGSLGAIGSTGAIAVSGTDRPVDVAPATPDDGEPGEIDRDAMNPRPHPTTDHSLGA